MTGRTSERRGNEWGRGGRKGNEWEGAGDLEDEGNECMGTRRDEWGRAPWPEMKVTSSPQVSSSLSSLLVEVSRSQRGRREEGREGSWDSWKKRERERCWR